MPARSVKSCCCPPSGDSECSLVISNSTSEMSGLGFHTLDCGYERPGSGFHISDSRIQIPDWRSHISDSRPHIPEPGLQIPAFRLHTKPNRSDTHELPINTSAVSVLVIIYNGSTAHLHFAQNSIFLNAAMQRSFGSTVQPAKIPQERSTEKPKQYNINKPK